MDKEQKLRDRGYFIKILSSVTKSIEDSFASFISILPNKIFRVRIENEKYFVNALEKTAQSVEKAGNSIRELKLADNLDKVQTDLIHTISSNTVQGFSVQNIDTLNVDHLSQQEVVAKLEELNKKLSTLDELALSMKTVAGKEVKIPAMPKSMAIDGEVGIDSLPQKLYAQLDEVKNEIRGIVASIKGIKLDVPQQKDIQFPKTFDVGNLSKVEKALKDLKKSIDDMPNAMPKVMFPDEIKTHVISEPPRLTPQPVTNFNINPITGILKTTAITVGVNPTLLPSTSIERRRHIQIFNNSDDTILYIGGSDVTVANGIPIDVKSFSQGIDAGSNMPIYGISTSPIEVRVLEITNNAAGQ